MLDVFVVIYMMITATARPNLDFPNIDQQSLPCDQKKMWYVCNETIFQMRLSDIYDSNCR